jgi:hypothetical protein
MHLRRTWFPLMALLAGLALAATACGSSAGKQLLVADDTSSGSGSARIWGVEPGEALDSSSLVARNALQPLSVTTAGPEGSWDNQLGVAWKGTNLLAYQTSSRSLVTAGAPGSAATTLAGSTGPLQAVVLRRGVAVVDQDGCSLATEAAKATPIGRGRCQISEDERWVVSWPSSPGALTIRDLRKDTTRVVRDIQATSASALDRDNRVLAVEQVDGGVRGRLIDATDGSTVGRTGTYQAMQALPATGNGTGFVALARTGQEIVLLWVATDGTTTEVDKALSIVPADLNGGVTYLRIGDTEDQDAVRRWSPGDDGPTTLLTGKVGVGAAGPGHVVATREVDGGMEFFTTGSGDRLERVLTLRTDTSQPVVVSSMQVLGDTAMLEVASTSATSFVRIDLTGDASVAPVRNWPYLVLESIDSDGTVLLSGSRDAGGAGGAAGAAGAGGAGGEQLLVVGPHDDTYQVRGRADATGINLIHDGVIYVTEQPANGDVVVRSLRSSGDRDPKVLYRKKQIAGATWPQNGGATRSQVMSRALIIQQQQSAQQQNAQQQGGAGGQAQGG